MDAYGHHLGPSATPTIEPSSPRFFLSVAAVAFPSSPRRIAIVVDLSDESAYAVKWTVQNYLRPGDAVILLHVCTTSVLYGADWGAIDVSVSTAKSDDAKAGRGLRYLHHHEGAGPGPAPRG
ncbi:universal stress protein PHOS34-like isoform X2 [Canna indica]|uniref:Universal stress protein PHOS34-like isoform X2 n=1 Tax=Canna indica TaxID=4628 RepID=A0AAQ3KU55_9LILI|nr:universal stress protein PHOS34-like isoform X2 [Canna indica]